MSIAHCGIRKIHRTRGLAKVTYLDYIMSVMSYRDGIACRMGGVLEIESEPTVPVSGVSTTGRHYRAPVFFLLFTRTAPRCTAGSLRLDGHPAAFPQAVEHGDRCQAGLDK